jgi:hypothetical protein
MCSLQPGQARQMTHQPKREGGSTTECTDPHGTWQDHNRQDPKVQTGISAALMSQSGNSMYLTFRAVGERPAAETEELKRWVQWQ